MIDKLLFYKPTSSELMSYKLVPHTKASTFFAIITALSLMSCAESVDREPLTDDDGGNGGGTILPQQVACNSHRTTFDTEVWPALISNCLSCHELNKISSGDLILLPESFNNHAQANFNTFQQVAAKTDINGISLLSVKPINSNNDHGGGTVLQSDSADYQIINNMVADLASCKSDGLKATDLDVGSDYQRLRKSTLALAGRLPTDQEEQQIAASSASITEKEIAFNAVLDSLLTRNNPYYFDRLKIMFNDLYLLDAFPGTRALGFDLQNYTNEDYFDTADLTDNGVTDGAERNTLRRRASFGLAQAPLELIAHVVREDRPFTEILTAKYMMVNAYSATIYNISDANFKYQYLDPVDKYDANEFRAVTLEDENSRVIPHSGILTTPTFMRRYPSTSTNRNRARSRVVFSYFLDINVLGLASREGLD